MPLPRILLCLAVLLLGTGVATSWGHRPPPPQYPDIAMTMAADLDQQLVPRLGMYTADNSRGLYWVIITTPAELGDLQRASPLARLFGQELASAFVALGYNVQEIRKSHDLVFERRQGEFVLSRDTRALATRHPLVSLLVAGTYTMTPAGVRYNIEVVDARNNNIVAMASRTLPMDATVRALSRGSGAPLVEPTVSTTDPVRFRREQEPYLTRHW